MKTQQPDINGIKVKNNAVKVKNNAVKVDNNGVKVDNNTVKVDNNTVKVKNNGVKVKNNGVKVKNNGVKVKNNTVKVKNNTVKIDFGSKDEYAKIYAVYFPKLVRFSQTYIMSRHDAENIVQDIFLYLWEHRAMLATLGNINAYLFAMVKNRCIDFLRNQLKASGRNVTLSAVQEKELELKLYSLQEFDERILSDVEVETHIHEAIESLPERCREVFVLSRLEGLRHKEVAEQLGITTHTVERQIQIALNKLRTALKDFAFIFVFMI